MTLAWKANREPDLAGYKIYIGTTSGTYSLAGSPFSTAIATSYIATNLPKGQTYFFAISAYDSAGNESVLSAEVSRSLYWRLLKKGAGERPGALLARRTRTMKLCSFDARSKGQPWPLPLREGIRNRTALPSASLEGNVSRRLDKRVVKFIVLRESLQADQNGHPTRPQGVRRLRTTLGGYFSILLRFGAAEARITIARLG